jgi:hypothetical protein
MKKAVRKINKNIKFSIEKFDMEDYCDDEFAIANVKFLSTKPNSHRLGISEKVLRQSAPSVLGKWIVAHLTPYSGDAGHHDPDERITGIFPVNQEIEFEDDNGYLSASAKAVLSKIYAKKLCDMFEANNVRDVSVEMGVDSHEEGHEEIVDAFNITGVTVLGQQVNGSCPDAEMSMVRFSENDATNFYNDVNEDTFEKLKNFSEERRRNMAGTTYKVNKTELKDTPWGDVDKTALRNKIMNADNKASLVKDVYLVVESGWEDAPSEKLKYPVMQLVGDTFYYNRYGLKSALGYAKASNDAEATRKAETLYKKFDLNEEKENMSDTKKFEVEGREAWGDVIKAVQDHEGGKVYVDSIEKDHIIYTKDDVRYRVDADVKVAPDDKKVSADIKWGTKKKDADQKMSDDEADMSCGGDKGAKMEDGDEQMSEDENADMSSDANVDPSAEAKVSEDQADKNGELAKQLAEKDDIIMGYEKELAELRQFKADTEEKAKCAEVDSTMAECKNCFEDDVFASLKEEGMACKMSELDVWKNKVKSVAFESIKNNDNKSQNSIWRMASAEVVPDKKGLWD